MKDAKTKMESFVPDQFQQEMRGMADALTEKGSAVTYDDIMLHMGVLIWG
jgi:hypothetical protein